MATRPSARRNPAALEWRVEVEFPKAAPPPGANPLTVPVGYSTAPLSAGLYYALGPDPKG